MQILASKTIIEKIGVDPKCSLHSNNNNKKKKITKSY